MILAALTWVCHHERAYGRDGARCLLWQRLHISNWRDNGRRAHGEAAVFDETTVACEYYDEKDAK